mmetsp:Transcript_29223/g.45767  ORF Transcript_29223/g.45767 Transcript_29223/m.45767 type:complete len:205 (+) Transcript_29223:2983-3597(+)
MIAVFRMSLSTHRRQPCGPWKRTRGNTLTLNRQTAAPRGTFKSRGSKDWWVCWLLGTVFQRLTILISAAIRSTWMSIPGSEIHELNPRARSCFPAAPLQAPGQSHPPQAQESGLWESTRSAASRLLGRFRLPTPYHHLLLRHLRPRHLPPAVKLQAAHKSRPCHPHPLPTSPIRELENRRNQRKERRTPRCFGVLVVAQPSGCW